MRIKNIICIIFSFIGMTLCLTGCINYDVTIKMDANGNAEIKETSTVKNEAFAFNDDPDGDLDAAINKVNESGNFDIHAERVENNGYTGMQITYKIPNVSINAINIPETNALKMYETRHESGKLIDVKKGLFTTNYDIDIIMDYSKNPRTGESDTSFLNFIHGNLVISIPVKANEYNADTVDKNTHSYSWAYDNSITGKPVHLNYTVVNILSLFIVLILFLSLIFVLIITSLIKSKQKNIKKCPYCGEKININANKCPYCGEMLINISM